MLYNSIRTIAAKVLHINKEKISEDTNIVAMLKKDEVDLIAFIIEIEAQSNKEIDNKSFKKLKTIDDIQKYLTEI